MSIDINTNTHPILVKTAINMLNQKLDDKLISSVTGLDLEEIAKLKNKSEFITHIADQHKCTKIEAEKVIDKFTSSVIDAIGQGKEISLLGFGNFTISKVAARNGLNPRTGSALKIAAYNQPKFKVGSKLKDAVNKK
jgi:DNA-binding protein HU-beta